MTSDPTAALAREVSEEPPGEPLPRRYGRYVLEELLGSGGMGRVYRATLLGPAGFRKAVAIKVLRAALRGRPGPARAFLREARLGAMLRHPNLLRTHDVAVHGAEYFIAMELVDGLALNDVRRRGPLPTTASLEIVRQAAEGLAHAHAVAVGDRDGLVHRDIKPANLMLDRHGVVRVVDFGLAAAYAAADGGTRPEGRVMGTLGYMAPEQLVGEPLDGRADIYSLGLVLLDLVLGRRSRLADTVDAVADLAEPGDRAVGLDRRVRSGRLGRELDACVPGLGPIALEMLAFDRDARTPRAADVARDLASLIERRGDRAEFRAWAAEVVPPPADSGPRTWSAPRLAPELETTNIGPEPDTFVGRAAELARILEHLESARVVTLTGFGGTGKTRLARRAARELSARYGGGCWFVDLASVDDEAGVARAAAAGLGLTLSGADSVGDLDRIGRTIAGWGEALLVLDNAEHVLDAAVAAAGRWVAEAPDLRLLVTSRRSLGLKGEVVLPLAPLPLEDAAELFVDRAGIEGVATDPVRELVARLDGLPLAIELAAARTGVLTPETILARLDDRFRLLQKRGDDRHAGLRACIEWSWELLTPWEQATLAQMSVFHGADLESIEAIVRLREDPDAPWIVDVVGSLLDQSLIVSEMVDGRPRFRLLESIRVFGAAMLSGAPDLPHAASVASETLIRDAHAVHYARLGSPDFTAPYRVVRDRTRMAAMSRDEQNIWAAFEHALARGHADDAALAFASGAAVLEDRGPRRRALAAGRRIQSSAGFAEGASDEALAAVDYVVAAIVLRSGRPDEALALIDCCLEAVEGFPKTAAMHRKGWILQRLGRMDDAIALQKEVVARRRPAREGLAAALCALGISISKQGRDEEVLPILDEAVTVASAAGDKYGLALALGNLAHVLSALGRPEDAERSLREALRAADGLDVLPLATALQAGLGEIQAELGAVEEAFRSYTRAREFAVRLGHDMHLALATAGLAEAWSARGNREAAIGLYTEALERAPKHPYAARWRARRDELSSTSA